MKVLTIGGATQDIFLACKDTDQITFHTRSYTSRYLVFNPQDKIEASSMLYTTGGGSINTAISFNKMGFSTSCFCKIGSDVAGNNIINELASQKIDSSLITIDKNAATGTSVIINDTSGDRVLLAYRGANSNAEITDNLLSAIKLSDIIYITSLSNKSAKMLPIIAESARKSGKKVAINPGKSQLTETGLPILKKSLQNIDILILNFNEAKLLTMSLVANDENYKNTLSSNPLHQVCATNIGDEHPYLIDNAIPHENLFFSTRNFFKETLKLGPSIVIITNGCNGVYLATKEQIYFHPSMKIPIIDTVGAGDSFGSAFVGNIVATNDIENSLRMGIANSASVLQHIGPQAGLLTREDQQERANSLNKSLLQKVAL